MHRAKQKRLWSPITLTVLLFGSLVNVVHADESLYEPCAGCHGANGEGKEASSAPRLAGQNARYLEEQLKHFRANIRGWSSEDTQGRIMAASVKHLSQKDIKKLAVYLASKDEKKGSSTSGEADRGETLYAENCLACHASGGAGIASLYTPNLRILSDWYIGRQLQAYRAGWRGDGSHGSTRAKGMRAIAFQVNDGDEITDIAAFLHR